jgi:ParB family chromosome partitioning protein
MTNERPPDTRPKRKALGQGLNALLGGRTAPAPPASGLRAIPIEAIDPNPRQPRKQSTRESLEEMAESIRAHGLLQPIIVSPLPGAAPERYQLIAGERRWRAAQLAGLHLVPALVREASPDQSLQIALVENLQREDLNAIEAAEAFDRLVAEFGLKHEEIARRTGKDRATISNFLRLLKLPAEVQELVRSGKLSAGHAKALLSLASAEDQRRTAAQLVAQDLSVRAAERLVGRLAAGEAQPRTSKVQRLDPNIRAALADLERLLGTRVRLTGGGKKGALIFEYYSPQDLMRIYDAIVKQDSLEV